jgi:hypothetical protein
MATIGINGWAPSTAPEQADGVAGRAEAGSEGSPPRNGRLLEGQDLIAVMNTINSEYVALRNEIGRLQDHQKQIMQFAYLVLPAAATLVAAVLNLKPNLADVRQWAFALAFVPPVYALLAMLYTDRTVKIMSAADYLHSHLRQKAIAATGVYVWQWEHYQREARLFPRWVLIILDKLRWLVFGGPIALSILGLWLFWVRGVDTEPWRILVLLPGLIGLLCTCAASLVAHEWRGAGNRTDTQLELDKFDRQPPPNAD